MLIFSVNYLFAFLNIWEDYNYYSRLNKQTNKRTCHGIGAAASCPPTILSPLRKLGIVPKEKNMLEFYIEQRDISTYISERVNYQVNDKIIIQRFSNKLLHHMSTTNLEFWI